MIVFWRLFLAMFAADFLLLHKMWQLRAHSQTKATLVRVAFFYVFAFGLCGKYLAMQWPFFGVWDLPGWVCVILLGILFGIVHQFFNYGGQFKHGHIVTCLAKLSLFFLLLFLTAPLQTLYETGHFFAQPAMIFMVGLVMSSRIIEWPIAALEQDKYGSLFLTVDEGWIMTLVRALFYLIMLLPGVRWLILFIVWLSACLYARHIRLMDVSRSMFYLSVIGSSVIGLLVRLRIYWIG